MANNVTDARLDGARRTWAQVNLVTSAFFRLGRDYARIYEQDRDARESFQQNWEKRVIRMLRAYEFMCASCTLELLIDFDTACGLLVKYLREPQYAILPHVFPEFTEQLQSQPELAYVYNAQVFEDERPGRVHYILQEHSRGDLGEVVVRPFGHNAIQIEVVRPPLIEAEQPEQAEQAGQEKNHWECIPDYAWDRMAVELLWRGYTDPEIAKQVNVSSKTVQNRFAVLRKQHPEHVPTRESVKRKKR